MKSSDLHFHRHDLVEVDGHVGYVNNICMASRSHLHPVAPLSYFTLTLKGTEGTARAVNLCVFQQLWSKVNIIEQYKKT